MPLALSRLEVPHLSDPKRTRPTNWRTLRTPEGIRPNDRDLTRAARTYAEAWYQALKTWALDTYDVPAPATSGRGSSVDLITSGTPGIVTVLYLVTPLGRSVNAHETAQLITDMTRSGTESQRYMERLLERIRGEASLNSLVHPSGRGWNQPSDRARDYAVAVLTLAVKLRDVEAERHLHHLLIARD